MSPTKLGVRLDAADDEHVVGPEGVLVEMDRKAFGRLADDDRLHAGAGSGSRRMLSVMP